MSVKRYTVFGMELIDEEGASAMLAHNVEVVLASDYAALQAKADAWKRYAEAMESCSGETCRAGCKECAEVAASKQALADYRGK